MLVTKNHVIACKLSVLAWTTWNPLIVCKLLGLIIISCSCKNLGIVIDIWREWLTTVVGNKITEPNLNLDETICVSLDAYVLKRKKSINSPTHIWENSIADYSLVFGLQLVKEKENAEFKAAISCKKIGLMSRPIYIYIYQECIL